MQQVHLLSTLFGASEWVCVCMYAYMCVCGPVPKWMIKTSWVSIPSHMTDNSAIHNGMTSGLFNGFLSMKYKTCFRITIFVLSHHSKQHHYFTMESKFTSFFSWKAKNTNSCWNSSGVNVLLPWLECQYQQWVSHSHMSFQPVSANNKSKNILKISWHIILG